MFVILGAGGHVGSETAKALLDTGQPVTAVLHSTDDVDRWQRRGARTAVVDVRDRDALREVLKAGSRAFLLNPPADVSTDTDTQEHATAHSIVAALENSGLEKVVAESTYGAQPGERCGDLNVLYDFEQALADQPIPAAIQRAAYYMSNWDAQLDEARNGTLTTMLPAEMKIPMVAPVDLGRSAARRLLEPAMDRDIRYVEGPERYSAQDVADAFATSLRTKVELVVTPRDRWIEAYRKLGFSQLSAESYAKMTAVSVDAKFEAPETVTRGGVSLQSYIEGLVQEFGVMSRP